MLEPQPWKSYKKKNHLTDEIKNTVKNIKFHPGQFEKFLTQETSAGGCGMELVKKFWGKDELQKDKSKSSGTPAKSSTSSGTPRPGGEIGFDREILIFRTKS